jgi:hypothetical protein
MIRIPAVFNLVFLFSALVLHAATPLQLDTLVWSFDTGSGRIFCGNDPIDSIVVTASVMRYFREHPVCWRAQEKDYTLPDTLFVGTMAVSTKLMVDKRFVSQGSMNRWLSDNREKLLSSITCIKPSFITTTIMLLKKAVQELQEGTEMLVGKNDSKFSEWSLNDRFLQAKQDILKLNTARDTVSAFLKNCPDTADAFYSYKKLFQIVMLLDASLGHVVRYSNALESADKRSKDEIATINSWINDILLGEMIAIESFCFHNVPTVKQYCYEDLVEYVINAEKRGVLQFSVEDLGKIRVRR